MPSFRPRPAPGNPKPVFTYTLAHKKERFKGTCSFSVLEKEAIHSPLLLPPESMEGIHPRLLSSPGNEVRGKKKSQTVLACHIHKDVLAPPSSFSAAWRRYTPFHYIPTPNSEPACSREVPGGYSRCRDNRSPKCHMTLLPVPRA